jgi:hypothetical protein
VTVMPHDLEDAEKAALVDLLTETIAHTRFPLSPRARMLRTILWKLLPPALEPPPGNAEQGEAKEATTIVPFPKTRSDRPQKSC